MNMTRFTFQFLLAAILLSGYGYAQTWKRAGTISPGYWGQMVDALHLIRVRNTQDQSLILDRSLEYFYNFEPFYELQLKPNSSHPGITEFEFYDKDTYGMSAKDAEASFKIYSDSDTTGFEISLQQDKNERYKKPFSFFLTSDDQSSGETLFVKPGDKIYVEYDDYTVPKDPEGKIGGPYLKGDHLRITDVATITR